MICRLDDSFLSEENLSEENLPEIRFYYIKNKLDHMTVPPLRDVALTCADNRCISIGYHGTTTYESSRGNQWKNTCNLKGGIR
jgi:hypothetical protein